ncbi:hypothetical protein N9544_00610 [Flavobacteriales bacterium]|nr:hypothetical protein [Flavobacteriales bacterium]
MMNKISILTLLIVLNLSLFSQKKAVGLEGKRFNLEGGVGISMFPGYIYFDDNYINSDNLKLGDIFSLKYNFELGYSITNKFKASFSYTQRTINIDSIDTYDDDYYYINNYVEFYAHNGFLDTKVKGYGVKINYYLHDFIAPVGGSIGLSFKKTFVTTKDHVFTSINVAEDEWGYEYLSVITDTSELKMNYTTIGFHYENMFFVSSKIPLYFKYGISTSLRIGKNATKGGEELSLSKLTDNYGDGLVNIHRRFLAGIYRHDIFEFNFGLGIIF